MCHMKLIKLKELILPSFWFFILLIYSPGKNDKMIFKRQESGEIKNSLFANAKGSEMDGKDAQIAKMQVKR